MMLARKTSILGYAPEHCPSRLVSVLPRRSPEQYTGSHSVQKCNVPDNPNARDIYAYFTKGKKTHARILAIKQKCNVKIVLN